MNLNDLVGRLASWNGRAVMPASVPHLLHHDFAFLWVLTRQDPPASWRPAIDAWRRLFCGFLLGEISGRQVPLDGRLLAYASPFGISSLVVFSHSTGEVAVSSPAVLVRPLPDADHAQLLRTLPDPQATDRLRELATLVFRFIQTLDDLTHPSAANRTESDPAAAHAMVVREIVDRHIVQHYGLAARERDSSFLTRGVDMPLWRAVDSALWRATPPAMVTVLTRSTLGLQADLLSCKHCNATLMRAAGDAIEVLEGDALTFTCPDGHPSEFPLEQFYVHQSGNRVVAWEDRGVRVGATKTWPVPTAHGNELRFEWDPMHARGDRRYITLRFPNRNVSVLPVAAAFFRTLLVVGDRNKFSGMPVKPEFFDFVEGVRPTVTGDVVEFRDVKVKGIPDRFVRTYLGPDIAHEPAGLIGVYPKALPSYWKRYRFCLGGDFGRRLGLTLPGTTTYGGSNVDVVTGRPLAVWVRAQDQDLGVGYSLAPVVELSGAAAPTEWRLAVDFGTSTTSIAFSNAASEGVVKPASLRQALDVLAGTGRERVSFLPEADYEPAGDDDSLFPSAIWSADPAGTGTVRWNSRPPSPEHHAHHGFKWDDAAPGGNSPLRVQYLDELLFLTAGFLLQKGRPAPVQFSLGFAFPLAFDHEKRKAFGRDLAEVTKRLHLTTSSQPMLFSLNESAAVVRAFGGANPGAAFLVADLGGGSLDLAVFVRGNTDNAFEFHQVGSIRFGGELLLRRVTRARAPQATFDDDAYWEVREAVTNGRVASSLASSLRQFHDAAHAFLPFALEIVRVAASAFLHHNPGQSLGYLLVGNGWRAAQFTQDRVLSVQDGLRDLVARGTEFGLSSLTPVQNQELLPKRYVSKGVMQAMLFGARHELVAAAAEDQSQLPAGLGIRIKARETLTTVPWHQLVGAQAAPVHETGAHYQEIDIQFDLNDAPDAPERWRRRLEGAMTSTNMTDPLPQMSLLLQHIRGAFATDRLTKGPLQVVAEIHWAKHVEGATVNE